MQTYFANTLYLYYSIFHLLIWNISLKVALHHDKNPCLMRPKILTNKSKWYLFTSAIYLASAIYLFIYLISLGTFSILLYSNAYAAFFKRWIGNENRFNLVINALAWNRYVERLVSDLVNGLRNNKLTVHHATLGAFITRLNRYFCLFPLLKNAA